jgi:hypothetical protein
MADWYKVFIYDRGVNVVDTGPEIYRKLGTLPLTESSSATKTFKLALIYITPAQSLSHLCPAFFKRLSRISQFF